MYYCYGGFGMKSKGSASYVTLFMLWCGATILFLLATAVPAFMFGNYHVEHRLVELSGSAMAIITIIAVVCGIGTGLALVLYAMDSDEQGRQRLIAGGREAILYWNLVGLFTVSCRLFYKWGSSKCDSLIASEVDPD